MTRGSPEKEVPLRDAVRAAPPDRGHVLIVEDDASARDVLGDALGRRRFDVVLASSGESALDRIAGDEPLDVVLTDLRMGDVSGMDLVERTASLRPGLPVIVVTAFGSIETAVAAMRRGAWDFLTKPYDIEVVVHALGRAIQHQRLQRELDALRSPVATDRRGPLIARSSAMRAVLDVVARIARSDATVLVTGETGTGKELVARTLHEQSARASGPFVAVNCAAIPEALLESELFGHARGSFTDAKGSRPGLFVSADGGTLFLDEVGEMPLSMQTKLLRALEEKRVRAVGADRAVPFDARVVAATNRDLDAEVRAGRFRQDLYFRLQVVDVALPPLRARGSDVLVLASHFLRRAAARHGRPEVRLGPVVAATLLRYDWPGNVRELENAIERALALAPDAELRVEDLPERIRRSPDADARQAPSPEPADFLPLDEVERRYVLRVLEAARGNKTVAAEMLGLDRSTLYRKLERWGAS